jgi:phospholipase C
MYPSRRDFLKGAIGISGAAVLGSQFRGQRAARAVNIGPLSTPSSPAVPGISGIDHVVVIMMENRSFDHFLGWLPGANGIGVDPGGRVVDEKRFESFSYLDPNGARHPIYHELQWNACGLQDQDHGYTGGRVQWDGGRMDGFLLDKNNTTYALSYYLAAQRAFSSPLAMQYTVCDNYFCSYLGPTWPNRFFQHAAQTDRQNDTVTPDGSSLPVSPATMPSIWDQLNTVGGPTGRYYFSDLPFLALWGPKYLPISSPFPQFLADAAAGTLPNLAVVDPRFEDEGSGTSGDDHPLSDIRAGDSFLSEVFHAVADSPTWSRTMMIVNYDEWGGFFDHVPPPVVAPGNQTLDLQDVTRNAQGVITGVLAGFRVPCIIASPFTRARHGRPRVSSYAYDHTSILRFVEWNWRLRSLTPRDASIPTTGASTTALTNLRYALDFSHPDPNVPDLPEVAPFFSSGCDVPGMPTGGPTVGGGPIPSTLSASDVPAAHAGWADLKASGLLEGWV